MGTGAEFNDEIGGTIHRLHEQLDSSLERSVDLHRTGAHEEAVLAETAVAVGAAKALEMLTGESWETQLERREDPATAVPPPEPPSPAGRWRKRNNPLPE
ncbi:MAG: hypothetical protein ABIS47_10090 [Acidimicrobiales bacterium]